MMLQENEIFPALCLQNTIEFGSQGVQDSRYRVRGLRATVEGTGLRVKL